MLTHESHSHADPSPVLPGISHSRCAWVYPHLSCRCKMNHCPLPSTPTSLLKNSPPVPRGRSHSRCAQVCRHRWPGSSASCRCRAARRGWGSSSPRPWVVGTRAAGCGSAPSPPAARTSAPPRSSTTQQTRSSVERLLLPPHLQHSKQEAVHKQHGCDVPLSYQYRKLEAV